MRKVLLVGLGGSGGKTLSYLMDELLADLKERTNEAGERWELDRLPACWSFIHIDVPAAEGDLGNGADKSVSAQGGRYVALGDGQALYRTFHEGVKSRFANASARSHGLGEFARWCPDPDDASTIPIQFGAGAYRAVGRVLTLAKSDVVYDNLKSAVQKLYEVSSEAEGVQVSNVLGFRYNGSLPPLVIFVSSMAGGSGASMILDVVDLLRSVTSDVPGFHANDTAAFLYTADVFRNITGVSRSACAGTLATVSELVSAAGRSTETWNETEWRTLSRTAPMPPADREIGRGPKMVTPVGASSAGRDFGTMPNDVYRGFAKMLMPLVNDDPSQTNYVEHVQTNFKNEVGNISGSFFAEKRDGTEGNWPMFFSGYGNANLTMGLDRYKEYAAQRLARQAAEILTRGHVPLGLAGGTVNQMVAKAAEDYYPTFLRVLGLEGSEASGSVPFDTSRVLSYALTFGDAKQVAREEEKFYSSDFGRQGKVSSPAIGARFNARQEDRKRTATAVSKRSLSSWSEAFLKSVEEALLLVISRHGLLVGEKTLEMLKGDLNNLANSLLKRGTDATTGANASVLHELANMAKNGSTVNANKEGLGFTRGLEKLMRQLIGDAASQTLAQVLSEFNSGVAPLLAKQMQDLRVQLEDEINAKRPTTTSAAFREAPISQWPVGNSNPPAYFQPAINEVLLTNIASYPTQFDSHISMVSGLSAVEGTSVVASEVLLRREYNYSENKFEKIKGWSENSINKSHPHLIRERAWTPSSLDVGGGIAQLPKYRLALTPQDLRAYANSWLGIAGSPFERHCREGISQWIAAEPSREQIFVNQLKVAMSFAEPLVAVEPSLVSIHQPGTEYGAKLSFSAVPLDKNSPAISQIVTGLSSTPVGVKNSEALEEACQPSSRATSIYITSSTPPISPWALKSLTAPVRSGYIAAGKNFWSGRRARPLMKFVPLGVDSIEAFLRGFIVGRITGSVRFETSTDGKKPLRVKVWAGESATTSGAGDWHTFSDRILYRGANSLGQETPKHFDTSKWNIPAVLLESLPLALTSVDAGNTRDLDPYKALINSGLMLRTLGVVGIQSGVRTELQKWYAGELPFVSEVRGCAGAGAAGIEAAETYLKTLEDECDYLLNLSLQDDLVFDNVQGRYEIAEALRNAARAVGEELRSDLTSKQSTEPETEVRVAAPEIESFFRESPEA